MILPSKMYPMPIFSSCEGRDFLVGVVGVIVWLTCDLVANLIKFDVRCDGSSCLAHHIAFLWKHCLSSKTSCMKGLAYEEVKECTGSAGLSCIATDVCHSIPFLIFNIVHVRGTGLGCVL